MANYSQKSSPASSSPSNLSPPSNSSAGSYKRDCAPKLKKDPFKPQAVNHQSPHSSYPSPSSKLGLAPPCQSMEPHGSQNQRGHLIGGQGGSQATSHTASTLTRGDKNQHLHAQSSPANPPATSSSNNSSSVPYSHFQPHPGLGHQGPSNPPPPAANSRISVPQQQQSGPHGAWRYQSKPSSHSRVSTNQSCSSSLIPSFEFIILQLLVSFDTNSRCLYFEVKLTCCYTSHINIYITKLIE